jgi:hypothetical protein
MKTRKPADTASASVRNIARAETVEFCLVALAQVLARLDVDCAAHSEVAHAAELGGHLKAHEQSVERIAHGAEQQLRPHEREETREYPRSKLEHERES